MNLISIWNLQFSKNQKLNKKSLYLIEALKRLKNKNKFHYENEEQVICPFQLINELFEVSNDFNNFKGNQNACLEIE